MRSYDQYCALAKALDIIGDRWTMLIARELLLGASRYSDLQSGLPGIPTNLLAARLRQLEEDGVVTRDDEGGYRLTPWGEYLGEPLRALARWGSPLMDEMEETETFRSTWLDFPVAFIFGGTQADRPRAEIEIRADGSPVTMESVQGEVRFRTGSAIAPNLVLTGSPAVVVGILSGRLDQKAAEGLGADVLGDFGILSRLRRTDFLSGPEALEGPRSRRKAASRPDK
ncbi:MAG TPA: helix-turn-helix domain-containing protein [Acidimicrobiales bacterium]